jgi:hypothetical protein
MSKKIFTITQAFIECARLPSRSRDHMEKCMIQLLKDTGTTRTTHGTRITPKLIQRAVNSFIYGIKQGSKGWYSDYRVVEDYNIFQIIWKQ